MSAVDPNTPLLCLLQLQRRAREAESPEALGFVMVNESLQLVSYRQAALWQGSGLGRVAAVSGLPLVEAQAPYVQWLGALCRHLQVGSGASTLGMPPQPLSAEQLPPDLGADWQAWLPEHALWLPLCASDGVCSAGLLLARETAWAAHEMALLQELAHAYAHALQAFQPKRAWSSRASALLQGRKRRYALVAVLLICLCPVRLSALAQAEVVPRNPFTVRAPLDGVIERFDVRPNEPVRPGSALFSLDTTALRTRVELARKAFDTAQEEYRQSAQAAVTNDKNRAETALRRGKLQEKSVEMAYTAEQLARVQVKSDRTGVAVFADSNEWIGKAVSLGERVLLIADPAQVELLAWLPAADLLPVAVGDVLRLYPQGAPMQSFDARVTSIAYRAELTREGFLAYRIKAGFETGLGTPPRMGQLGTARLQAGWAPLAYVVLRRPLAVLRQWLGW